MALPNHISAYHAAQSPVHRKICVALAKQIEQELGDVEGIERKVWHRHPVWFIDGNPIVGYSTIAGEKKAKGKNAEKAAGQVIRLMFWSGESFNEPGLPKDPAQSTFKSAAIRYASVDDIDAKDLKRWLKKSVEIQWDYKNLVKRKGKLERLG